MTVALYVPGDRPERFEKAIGTGADIVILDLEDAVGHDRKAEARSAVAGFLQRWEERPAAPVQLQVRVASATDIDMVAPHAVGIRLPKVRSAEELDAAVERIGGAAPRLHAIVEDAIGVSHLEAIAAHPAVASVALGESDLRSELGASSPAMLEHLRIRLVLAVRAAGLEPPLMSAYPAIRDLDGLEADCRAGAALGFGGRTAVHPSQVDVIRRAFTPPDRDIAWAQQVRDALDAAHGGVTTLASGEMVDAAMSARAQRILQAAPRAEPPAP